MLVKLENVEEFLSNYVTEESIRFTAKNMYRRALEEIEDSKLKSKKKQRSLDTPPILAHTNPGARKICLVLHFGSEFFVYAKTKKGYSLAMNEIFNLELEGTFPDERIKSDWKKSGEGKPYIFLNQCEFTCWKSALEVGFEPLFEPNITAEEIQRKRRMGDARLWYITGKPRFSKFVKHPCRVVVGSEELVPLLRQGVSYGEELDYITRCALKGPSFVCEVNGQPVCWSGTHLSGAMGMIYTPVEHRRKGYAKSLAAFQIDYMLKTVGIAVAHVMLGNRPSEQLLKEFGAQHLPGTIVWRSLTWPKRKWKKLLS